MGDTLPEIPANGIDDVCDYCGRGFRRAPSGPMCPNCGLDNVRPESAMVAPAEENAVKPHARARRTRRKKEMR